MLGLLLLVPSAAIAHGVLRSSRPAAGARLTAVPTELRLVFNEAVERAVARLTLLGPDSQAIALGALRQPGDSTTVLLADITGPLTTPGRYTVNWQVVGRDGHPVSDRFTFVIADGAAGLVDPAALAPADTAPAVAADSASAPAPSVETNVDGTAGVLSPFFVATRWLGYAALLAMIGVIMVRYPLLSRVAGTSRGAAARLEPLSARAASVGMSAAMVMLAAAMLRLLAQGRAVGGNGTPIEPSTLGALLGSTAWGWAWLVQVAAAAIAAGALFAARRGDDRMWVIAAIAIVAVAYVQPMFGHAAAASSAPLAVFVHGTHVLGAGGWLGALLVIVTVGLPLALRAPEGERGPVAASLVNAFSPLALGFAALVAATGVASTWMHAGSIAAILDSGYGRVLLIKLGLLVLVAAIGAWNWRRVRPACTNEAGARRLRRTAATELAVGALVLAATAVLVATPTPTELLR